MAYKPKIVKGIVHDTGLPIDGCTLTLGLWDWDNYSDYHLHDWENADDEAVMKTMHKQDALYCDMPLKKFKKLWKSEEYEPDGVYCIPLDKVSVLEIIREEIK